MPVFQRCAALFALTTFALAAHAAGDAGSCRYVPIADVPIRLSGPTMEPLIDGAIDSAPAVMLVDTGAPITTITRSTAEKRGIALMLTGQFTQGVGGVTQLYGVRLKDFSAGPARVGKVGMPVSDDGGAALGFDGIIGAEFLLQTDMELALTSKQLRFFRATDCGNTYLAYWDKEALEIPFVNSDSTDLNPQFTVMVNGKPLLAALDTGASHSMITQKAAELAGVQITSPGVQRSHDVVRVGTKQAAGWNASFDSFGIGAETIKNADLIIMDAPASGNPYGVADVILGRDFLRAHRILFAMSQRRLYLSYTGGPVFSKPPATGAAAQ